MLTEMMSSSDDAKVLLQFDPKRDTLQPMQPREHLSNTNRAALIVHEAVYKILRERELARNSRKARMTIRKTADFIPAQWAGI